ncbi:hypothetical protein, partial [Escherichia coli]|uniref:hypothetical protein n=1 Tax=Escherichia coli TaxID=562 RepID=UPI0039E13172
AAAALAEVRPQTAADTLVPTLTRLFDTPDPDQRLAAGHALAKTLDDQGRPGEAFDWLVKAKAAKQRAARYVRADDAALFRAAA